MKPIRFFSICKLSTFIRLWKPVFHKKIFTPSLCVLIATLISFTHFGVIKARQGDKQALFGCVGKIYYFAYGHHLSRKEMESVAPGHRVYGFAYLEDYQLTLNAGQLDPEGSSTANIMFQLESRTDGLLYELLPTDLAFLDDKETAYFREQKRVFIPGIQAYHPAWVYSAKRIQTTLPLLAYVYKLYNAARIIPGFQPKQLETLEKWVLALKP
jgi:hypothetical protein